jgi:hypothetical protein
MSDELNLRVALGGSVVILREDDSRWHVELFSDQERSPYTSEYANYRSAKKAFDSVVAKLKAATR